MSAKPAGPPTPPWAKVLIALGLLIVAPIVLLFGWMGIDMLQREVREPATRIAAKAPGESYAIGEVVQIADTPYVRISIAASRDSGGAYSYDRGDLRNILLLDTRNGTSRRLLPTNARRIEAMHWLPDQPTKNANAPVASGAIEGAGQRSVPERWYVLTLPRGDDRSHDVVVGRIDGGQAQALTAIDGVESVWTHDSTHMAKIVRNQRRLTYQLIDMGTLKALPPVALAID